MTSSSLSESTTCSRRGAGEYVCEMDKLFRGDLVTVTQCLACETKREKHEEFYDRSIPIDDTVTAVSQAAVDSQEVIKIFLLLFIIRTCVFFIYKERIRNKYSE